MSAAPRTSPPAGRPRFRPWPRPGPGFRLPGAVRAAGPALAAYAAIRLTGLLALYVGAALAGEDDPTHRLHGRWDSVWYQRIAAGGYGYEARLPDGGTHPDLAFFPLLPLLERALSAALPLSLADAGILVGCTASLAAAWGIYAVGSHVFDRRAGVLLAALWGALPVGYVQWMAYTESLFTALAAWSLYAALTGRWLTAGLLSATAGLCRPTGAALVAALAVAALGALRSGAPGGRVLCGLLLAPLGWLSYVTYVGVRRGTPLGYFDVQADWDNRVDGGAALLGFAWRLLSGPWPDPLGGLGVCAALALAPWLLWRSVRQGQPAPLVAYSCAVVVLSLAGSAYFGSRPRLMMPAFPLLLPLATALATWPSRRRATALVTASLASAAYAAVALLGDGPP
ncbi:hypothetical protein [Streptomyces sp. 6N223]|uniref:hypothetical protein n=1 Tax=Streptomyces sp. 6N223 TaxID=3457412 RepID=UPI003FD69FEC